MRAYPDLAGMKFEELAAWSQYGERRADPAGKLIYGKDGRVVYGFGKHKGVAVLDEPGFGKWALSKDFPETTKAVLRRILNAAAVEVGEDVF